MKTDRSMATGKPQETAARARLDERYRDPEFTGTVADVPWNDTLDLLLSHRTVRAYSDSPLEPGMLETIVAAAQSAPTTSNLQAWSVIAVQEPDRKARLAELSAGQKHIFDAPLLLVFIADLARLRAVSNETGEPGAGLDYLEAFIFAIADASFGAQNAVVAIESLGLGCCYIGAMRNQPDAVARELGLPDETMVVFGMTVGHPDPARKADVKPRLPQSVVLHHETYARPDPAALSAYDERLKEFQSEQRMRIMDWTAVAASRVRDEAALTGRHVMTEHLRRRGFTLR